MSSIHQVLEAARSYMGKPTTEKINKDDLFMMLIGRLNYYRQKLGITDQNWLIATGYLNVDQQNNEYKLNIADFSRPIKVEFYDPNSPNRNGPEIEIVSLQNTDRFNTYPTQSYLYGDADNTGTQGAYIASAISFYGMPPADITVRIIPVPVQAVQYKIYYEPAILLNQAPTFAEDPSLMAQFHDMLALATALVALPRCGHDPNVFQQYDNTLSRELARVELVFDTFRLSRNHKDTRLRRPFRPGGGQWIR